ncbi:conjugal transfer protein TraA [Xanthobacter dioxanivorans]|uniref:Conjugal transfer protein TraA n=1 Tax=Xanthobacter dioxanivorans TaxID=2528964 RepID=A0A974PNX8_9HYPH|nr:conjugal transfer protein TraA [Xanthobacter dioxanivorans]
MASDYEPARDYAERRGITFRARMERVVEIVRQVPEKVRGMFDGLRLPAKGALGTDAREQPEREKDAARPERENAGVQARRDAAAPDREIADDPEAGLRRARTEALKRHARAVDTIFSAEDAGRTASPGQWKELTEARKAFDDVRPHGWEDAEAAYAKDPDLAREAGTGKVNRAICALQLETQIRTDPARRADRFVQRWRKLDQTSQRQYAAGDMSGYKATRSMMGDMAKSLERDPQLESLLAGRKQDLEVVLQLARIIGRRMAREDFAARTTKAANDNAPKSGDEQDGGDT